MAYSYKVTVMEVGDKVVAQGDVYDEQVENLIESETVVTIKEIEKSYEVLDDGLYLTFEEVEGQYRDEYFQLHESVIVRT